MSDLLHKLKAANLAYRAGTPIMSDAEFDALEDVVRSLPDPTGEIEAFLNSIGAPADSRWVKIRHLRSMTSLNKAQTPAEFDAWKNSVARNQRVVWSEKLDGLSCFDEGTLVHLANGERLAIGDIVRNNLRPAVLTWSPESGIEVSQITEVHDNGFREDWVRLTLEDGSSITVTSDHQFYVKDKGWISAKDLLHEDIVTPDE